MLDGARAMASAKAAMAAAARPTRWRRTARRCAAAGQRRSAAGSTFSREARAAGKLPQKGVCLKNTIKAGLTGADSICAETQIIARMKKIMGTEVRAR
jgi:hypothetical protein